MIRVMEGAATPSTSASTPTRWGPWVSSVTRALSPRDRRGAGVLLTQRPDDPGEQDVEGSGQIGVVHAGSSSWWTYLPPDNSEARGGDQAHDRGREEDDDQAVVERLRDQVREELLAGQRGRVARRDGRQRARWARAGSGSGCSRGTTRTATRPAAAGDLAGGVGRARPGRSARSAASRQAAARPATISEKKMPIDSALPELKKVPRMPDGGAALVGRHAVHDRRWCWARRRGRTRGR